MAAQEEQQQRVVLGLGRTRTDAVQAPQLPAAPRRLRALRVDQLPSGDGDEPALRLLGPAGRPPPHRLHHRLLDGVLGRAEVGSATDEEAQHLRSELPEQLGHIGPLTPDSLTR